MVRGLILRGLQALRKVGASKVDSGACEIAAAIEAIEQALHDIRAEFGIVETR